MSDAVEQVLSFMGTWTATSTTALSTATQLTSVNPTHVSALEASLSNAVVSLATVTSVGDIYSLSYVIRGAQASLTAVSAEQVVATATASLVQAQATHALWDATLNLQLLKWDMNLYDTWVNKGGNGFFTAVYLLLFVIHIIQMFILKYYYVGIALFCGIGLEWAGYLGRTLAADDTANQQYFLLQIVALTIAPAFVMGAVYYYLAKLIVVHGKGRRYSLLKPTWYSLIFVFCDVLSLVVQAIGGGMASAASSEQKSPKSGTDVMIAGIAFQVFSMSLFAITWFDFLYRVHFLASPEMKFSFKRLWALLINSREADQIRETNEPYYVSEYRFIRERRFFKWFPHAITWSIIFIYIRCVYRVVELAQGWSGYLITHEEYVLTLDAMMVWFCVVVLALMHPMVMFGNNQRLPLRERKADAELQNSNEEFHDAKIEPLEDQSASSEADTQEKRERSPERGLIVE